MSNQKTILIKRLNKTNFNESTLDSFIRYQEVTECWRQINGEWMLVSNQFTENWSLDECRKIAKDILGALESVIIAFGAFDEDALVGFIILDKNLFGSKNQYLELISFEVSEPYRNQGIGRKLFKSVCEAARKMHAKKLYISTHSSKESHAAYCKLGCVLAEEINPISVEKEPCDIQMEYVL